MTKRNIEVPAGDITTLDMPQGMSLRNWFAGMAMQAFVSDHEWDDAFTNGNDGDPTDCANNTVSNMAYGLADAMLQASGEFPSS